MLTIDMDCTEPGCVKKAVGHGLCARHYQAKRRRERQNEEKTPARPRGRPMIYEGKGAPKLPFRVDQDVYDRVLSQDSPRDYLQRLVREDMAREGEADE